MVIRPRANGLDADTAFGVFAGPIGDERQPGKDFGSIIPRYRRAFKRINVCYSRYYGTSHMGGGDRINKSNGNHNGDPEKELMKNTV